MKSLAAATNSGNDSVSMESPQKAAAKALPQKRSNASRAASGTSGPAGQNATNLATLTASKESEADLESAWVDDARPEMLRKSSAVSHLR